MLGRLYPEKSFELSSILPEDIRWPLEEHDLNEILGNLLDNAGKWSGRCVELSLSQHSGTLKIGVVDDGAGVADAEIGKLGQRGLRLDEQTPGHGLGLAIALEIVERYGGTINFSAAPERGLRVLVDIPALVPATK